MAHYDLYQSLGWTDKRRPRISPATSTTGLSSAAPTTPE